MLDEEKFWDLIEDAWVLHEKGNMIRLSIIKRGSKEQELKKAGQILNEKVIPSLLEILESLSKSDLAEFNKILIIKLYDIDRLDVHKYIGGSDDGFLYNRGFVIGMGEDFYYKIYSDPIKATNDNFSWDFAGLSAYDLCFMARNLYRELYDEEPPETGVSMESYSNKTAWPSEYW